MSRFRIIFSIFLITIALFTIHADSNGIWTYPRDVTPGVFGEDESSNPTENYTFNNVVYFNEPLTTNHELITNSRITANDIFYTTSNIGIGVINPTNRLEVAGNIESNQLIDSNDNSYLVNPNGVSNMYRIVADAYFSPGSTAYYVNPSGTSRVGVVNANTLQIGGQHTDNRYVNEGQANSISNSMLQNNAVTSTKILDNSITSSDILDGTISGTDLVSSYRSGNVYDSRFVNEGQSNSISNSMLQNNAVTSAKIADNSITAADLGANSVGSSEIATNSVGADELSSAYQSGSAYDGRFIKIGTPVGVTDNSVTSSKITDNSILERDLRSTNNPINNYILSYDSGSGGFTWVQDQVGSVGDSTPDTIADDGIIQENEIQQNSLDDSEIQDNSLTASSLAANSVGNSELIDSPTFTTVNANSFIYNSDRILKENIENLTFDDANQIIKNLNPTTYNFIGSEREEIGLIAQEVQEFYPEIIHKTENETLAVDYVRLIIPLIKVVQEQQKQIQELEQKIKEEH